MEMYVLIGFGIFVDSILRIIRIYLIILLEWTLLIYYTMLAYNINCYVIFLDIEECISGFDSEGKMNSLNC